MKVDDTIEFSEADFKEVFSLFASSTAHELKQVDDPASEHYFERVDLMKEYELSYEKARVCYRCAACCFRVSAAARLPA
jgi:hypothetical protein